MDKTNEIITEAKNYNSVKFIKSSRGAGIIALTILELYWWYNSDILIGFIFYLPFIYFAYKSKVWSLYVLFVLFAIELLYQISQLGSYNINLPSEAIQVRIGFVMLFFALYPLRQLFKAIKVEKARANKAK